MVTTGRLSHIALDVATREQLPVDLFDLQQVAPVNVEAIVASISDTSRALVIHDESGEAGVAAALTALLYQKVFWMLDAPIGLLTSPNSRVPAAKALEDAMRDLLV